MNKNNLIYLWQYLCVLLSSLSIYLFWQSTVLVSLILIIFSILINLKSKTHEIIFFITISILATIVESFTISSGAWVYSNQHFFNFSLWLPLYWGMGGIAMKNIYLILKSKSLNSTAYNMSLTKARERENKLNINLKIIMNKELNLAVQKSRIELPEFPNEPHIVATDGGAYVSKLGEDGQYHSVFYETGSEIPIENNKFRIVITVK